MFLTFLIFFLERFFYIYDNLWVWLYCAQYFNLFAQWKYRPYTYIIKQWRLAGQQGLDQTRQCAGKLRAEAFQCLEVSG